MSTGSWSGDIRLWKLNLNSKSDLGAKAKVAFTLIGRIPTPGCVNSLQLLSVPHATVEQYEWLKRLSTAKKTKAGENTDASEKSRSKESLVIVAGLGQELRLGRWKRTKEGGACNGLRVYVLDLKEATRTSTA